MISSKKKGKWIGGRPSLGYDIDKVNKRLVINLKEAELVRKIFDLYLEKRSLLSVAIALNEKDYITKSYKTAEGSESGGLKFKTTSIQTIIKNPFYIGKVNYSGALYQGEQERIISDEIFQKAQEILANNYRERKSVGRVKSTGLLNSILRCKACESSMYYIYSRKGNHKYHYYLCMNAQKRGYKSCPTRLISAQVTEDKFMEFLRTISKDQRIEVNAWEALTLEERIPILKSIAKVAHYDANNGILEIMLHNSDKSHQFALKLAELKHTPFYRQQEKITKEPPIRQNLILGYQISEIIKEKKCSIQEVAHWTGIIRPRLCQFVNMLLLSPKIQEEILLSEEKALFNIPEYKLRDIIAEIDWNSQQKLWNNLLESHQK
ncbi:MAG: recombinase family protein [Candidatus Omnitrophota bacterium]|jgi:hypothetical protein